MPGTINYEYYKVFHEIAECKNITIAAKRLYLTQSTLSRTLQLLEKELGYKLFVRSIHGVSLTKEGELLYQYVHQAIESIQMAETKLQYLKDEKRHMINVGASGLQSPEHMQPYVEQLKAAYPGTEITLRYGSPDRQIQLLRNGLLDMIIVVTPYLHSDDLMFRKIGVLDYVMIAGDAFSYLAEKPQDIGDLLENHPIISMPADSSTERFTSRLANSHSISIKMNTICEMCSLSELMSFVQSGMGIALVPSISVKLLVEQGYLHIIPLKEALPKEEIGVLTCIGHPMDAVTIQLIQILGGKI